jgi:3-oxoacyl-[acyl-carrier-protein] synthase II
VVTGVGLVTPLGDDCATVWSRLLAGESAARSWDDLATEGFPIAVACRVEGDLGEPDPLRRGRALARRAAAAALTSAGLGDGALPSSAGVMVGTTMGESAGFEAAAAGASVDLAAVSGQVLAADLADWLGSAGPRRTYGTACAAGNYAIGAAARAVSAGRSPVMLAAGVDPFSRIALLGFARLRAMAADRCRPFDAGRTGMQLGEAAAFLVVEDEASALARGARPLAVVAGLGLSGDAHHPTSPRPDGSGMAAAIRAGLAAAGVAPGEVGWVNAHGTGTAASDAAEARAIADVFGDGAVPVSSQKGAFGHCLGAAGAVEAVVSVLALGNGVVPPTVNVGRPDQALPVDVVTEPRPAAGLSAVVSCGFAFGGLNSALVLCAP